MENYKLMFKICPLHQILFMYNYQEEIVGYMKV